MKFSYLSSAHKLAEHFVTAQLDDWSLELRDRNRQSFDKFWTWDEHKRSWSYEILRLIDDELWFFRKL